MNDIISLKKNIQNKSQLMKIVSNKLKKTILLTTYQEHINNQTIFAISQWLMGRQVKYDTDKQQPVWQYIRNQKQLVQRLIPQQNPFLQILEVQNYRIIAFSLRQWKKLSKQSQNELNTYKGQKYVQHLMLLSNVIYYLNSCIKDEILTKCYTVIEYDKKNILQEKQILQNIQKYIKMPEMGIIQFNYKGQQTSHQQNIKIKTKNWNNYFDMSLSEIFSYREQSQQKIQMYSFEFINTNDKQAIIKNWLTKESQQLEQILTQFMCVIINIVKSKKSQKQKYKSLFISPTNKKKISQKALNLTYLDFIQKYKVQQCIVPQNKQQIESYYECLKQKYDLNWNSHKINASEQLVYLYLLSEFKVLLNYFSEHESLQELKNLFSNISCLLYDLSPLMNQKLLYIENVKVFLQLIIDEIIQFKNISTLSWATRKVKQNANKILPKNSQVFKLIVQIEPQENKQLNYYDDFLYLIKSNFSQKQYKNSELKDIQSKKYYRQMQIKNYKAQKIYNSQEMSQKQIVIAIKSQFYIYNNKQKISSQFQNQFKFNKILNTCAKHLRTIGKSDLAFKIYKKLKYIFIAQDCLKQIAWTLTQEKKAIEYLYFSQYLESMGYKELSMKYSQLAYQIDQQYISQMTKSKINILINNKNSQTQFQALSLLKQKKINENEYLQKGYQFDEQFQSSIYNLDEKIQQPNQLKVTFKDGLIFQKIRANLKN